MKHPEVILVPVLALSDYYLTVLGSALKAKRYDAFVRLEHYELNPGFQDAIARKQWVNPRALIATAALTLLLLVLAESSDLPPHLVVGFIGCATLFYASLVGRHVANIMIFRLFIRRSGEVTGHISYSHHFMLTMSTYAYLSVAVPVVLLAIFSPTPFAIGGAVGVALLFLVHSQWTRTHVRQEMTANANTEARPDTERGHEATQA